MQKYVQNCFLWHQTTKPPNHRVLYILGVPLSRMSCNKVVFFVRPVETLKIITRDGEGLEIDTSVGRNPKLRLPLVV